MNGVKERPILMTGMMVRPTLADSKRMTRRLRGLEKLNAGYYRDRIGKVECRDGVWCFWEGGHGASALPVFQVKCPYGVPGDLLWVRETWRPGGMFWDKRPRDTKGCGRFGYQADGEQPARDTMIRWRPSIHMPRWASRITLEVTDVRVERLQEITEADALAEGIAPAGVINGQQCFDCDVLDRNGFPRCLMHPSARGAFAHLWESINGPGSWEGNPWVWVIGFKRIKTEELGIKK